MKCCSRSTLGVIVGILNVICNIGLIIYSIVSLTRIEKAEQQQNEIAFKRTKFSVVIVVCVVMAIISGLLIVGIVKRRHKLMLPWVIISWVNLIMNFGFYFIQFLKALFLGASLSIVFALFIGLLGFGFAGLILWAIFTVYRDIRQDYIKNRRLGSGAELGCN